MTTPKQCSFEELFKLWSSMTSLPRIMHIFMFCTAYRFVDISRMKWTNFDFERGGVWLDSQKNGVLNEYTPLPYFLLCMLYHYFIRNFECIIRSNGYFFPSSTGRSYSNKTWSSQIQYFRAVAGLSEQTIYGFGKDGRKLRRLSGHSSKVMFAQYCMLLGFKEYEIQAALHHKHRSSSIHYFGNVMLNQPLRRIVTDKLWNE